PVFFRIPLRLPLTRVSLHEDEKVGGRARPSQPADEGVLPNPPCFARLKPASSHLPYTEDVYHLEDRGMHAASMTRFLSVCAAAALPLLLATPVRAGVNLPNNGKVDRV